MRIDRRAAVFLHDTVMTLAAWELAWLARFNFELPGEPFSDAHLRSIPLLLAVQVLVSWRFGLYRGLWRFASVQDLWNIIRAAAVGAVLVTLALFLATRLTGIPRSVMFLYPAFLVLLLGGPRLVYRIWKDHRLNLRQLSGATRTLVVGAGQAGETLVRNMLRDGRYLPVGLVDDKRRLRGARIHGVPVLGGIDDITRICHEQSVEFIVIAIPSATARQMQRIVEACEASGLRFRTLPKARDLATGSSYLTELRDVSIEDLIGRERVELDWARINAGLAGRRVLVTGGGGSIGSELCRQLARIGPSALIVLDQSEFNLFRIERELRARFPALRLHTELVDVCDAVGVARAFERGRPDVVFHAAAYKHVPMLEGQVREAVRNNVIGTRVVAEAAVARGVGEFVLISTDKAVNPTSVMGLAKRVAEQVCEALAARGATRFITVRFGNVLNSAGSVVPLFAEQIAAGGPVTVTHPEATRYFMTIPEACQLIMQAAVMGEGGEIFVLDMGEPVRIQFLAEQMIRLAGHEPGVDIEIAHVGLRPGEKLHEELFHDEEAAARTDHPKIRLARQRALDRARFQAALAALVEAVDRLDDAELVARLRELVPEYRPRREGEAQVVELRHRHRHTARR